MLIQVLTTAIHTSQPTAVTQLGREREAGLEEFTLLDEIGERCLKGFLGAGLAFAGIDLKLTLDGDSTTPYFTRCRPVTTAPGNVSVTGAASLARGFRLDRDVATGSAD